MYCSNCGEYVAVIDIEDGIQTGVCDNCGEKIKEEVDANEPIHN